MSPMNLRALLWAATRRGLGDGATVLLVVAMLKAEVVKKMVFEKCMGFIVDEGYVKGQSARVE